MRTWARSVPGSGPGYPDSVPSGSRPIVKSRFRKFSRSARRPGRSASRTGANPTAGVLGRALLCLAGLSGLFPGTAVPAGQPGQAAVFQIDEPDTVILQTVNVQDERVKLKQAGGDPALDLLFDARLGVLFLIDHGREFIYRFDQGVLDRIEMIMGVFGLAGAQPGQDESSSGQADADGEARYTRETGEVRSIGEIRCSVFQQMDGRTLESEWCMATRDGLAVLGGNYETLAAFYDFGDRLLAQATVISRAIGISVPQIRRPDAGGLPVQVLTRAGTLRINLKRIREQPHPAGFFVLPAYREVPIPFVS